MNKLEFDGVVLPEHDYATSDDSVVHTNETMLIGIANNPAKTPLPTPLEMHQKYCRECGGEWPPYMKWDFSKIKPISGYNRR